jgi:aspartate aminotransferase-like enzyme
MTRSAGRVFFMVSITEYLSQDDRVLVIPRSAFGEWVLVLLANSSRRKEMATSTEVAIFNPRIQTQPLKRWAILPNAAVPP